MINLNNLPTKTDIHDADEFLTETVQSEETRNTPYSVIRQNIESNLITQLNSFMTILKNNQHKAIFRETGQTIYGNYTLVQIDMSSFNPGSYYSLELKVGLNLYLSGVLTECMSSFNTELFVYNNVIKTIISNDNSLITNTNNNNFSSIVDAIEQLKNANTIATGKTILYCQNIQQDESLGAYYKLPNIEISNTITDNKLNVFILSYNGLLDYNIKVTKNKFS